MPLDIHFPPDMISLYQPNHMENHTNQTSDVEQSAKHMQHHDKIQIFNNGDLPCSKNSYS